MDCAAYECTISDFRMFLDAHGIVIDQKLLIYQGKKFDILFLKCKAFYMLKNMIIC